MEGGRRKEEGGRWKEGVGKEGGTSHPYMCLPPPHM